MERRHRLVRGDGDFAYACAKSILRGLVFQILWQNCNNIEFLCIFATQKRS